MRKFAGLIAALFAIAVLAGCASGDTGTPPPAGDPPKAVQAEPGMKSPEERAREAGGGGEGS